MKTAYISGHLDLTAEEWNEHYKTRVLDALDWGHSIVVGDARGCDLMAQIFIKEAYKILHLPLQEYKPRVTIYHMFNYARNNVGNFGTQGGFKSDKERDEAMTADSDYDIAWIRPGREKSGTAKNIKRRENCKSKVDQTPVLNVQQIVDFVQGDYMDDIGMQKAEEYANKILNPAGYTCYCNNYINTPATKDNHEARIRIEAGGKRRLMIIGGTLQGINVKVIDLPDPKVFFRYFEGAAQVDIQEPPPRVSFEIQWLRAEKEQCEGDFGLELYNKAKEHMVKHPRVRFSTVIEGYIDPETGERVGRELLLAEKLLLMSYSTKE